MSHPQSLTAKQLPVKFDVFQSPFAEMPLELMFGLADVICSGTLTPSQFRGGGFTYDMMSFCLNVNVLFNSPAATQTVAAHTQHTSRLCLMKRELPGCLRLDRDTCVLMSIHTGLT